MKTISFLLVFVVLVLSTFSCKTGTTKENTTQITGRVQIYGNEPFTFVGIIDENNVEYMVHPPSVADELRNLQGRLIEFNVTFLKEEQRAVLLHFKGKVVTPVSWKVIR